MNVCIPIRCSCGLKACVDRVYIAVSVRAESARCGVTSLTAVCVCVCVCVAYGSVGCSSYIKGPKCRTVSTGLKPGLNGQDEWKSPLAGCVCPSGLREELSLCVYHPRACTETGHTDQAGCGPLGHLERLYPVSRKMRTHSDGPQVKTTDRLITRTPPLGQTLTLILGFLMMKKTLSVPTRLLGFTLHRTKGISLNQDRERLSHFLFQTACVLREKKATQGVSLESLQ